MSKKQFEIIEAKLDRIIELLEKQTYPQYIYYSVPAPAPLQPPLPWQPFVVSTPINTCQGNNSNVRYIKFGDSSSGPNEGSVA